MILDPALLPWADKIIILVLAILMFASGRGQRVQTFPVPAVVPPVVPPAPVGPAPPVVVPPAPPVVVPPVTPPAPPVVPPAPPAPGIPRFTSITTTSFAGVGDSEVSKESAYYPGGYPTKVIDSTKPGAALPYHFPGTPPVIRIFCRGKTVDCHIVDVGPWNTHDPYWDTGSRPQAETGTDTTGRHTNRAGLDLTPGAWAALGKTGNLDAVTDITSWDFVTVLDKGNVASPVPIPHVGSAQPATVTVLQPNTWPTQAECPAFYGDAATVKASLVNVQCPWLMNGKTHTIQVHSKCAASLERVLNYIWEYCDKSQDKIHSFEYDIFDGSYVPRNIAGTSTPSVHSYAAALDFDAARNQQLYPLSKTTFKANSLIVYAFKAESWVWGGDWTPASIDAMHFQAARVR